MSFYSKKILLLVGDIVVFYLSLWIGLGIRYLTLNPTSYFQANYQAFSLIFLAWLIIFYIANLYDLRAIQHRPTFFNHFLSALGIGSVFALTYFYLTPHKGITPKTNLLVFLIVFSVLFYAWRQTYLWFLTSRLPRQAVAVIGYSKEVKQLADEINKASHLGLKLVLIIATSTQEAETAKKETGLAVVMGLTDLGKHIKNHKISILVLAADPRQSPEVRTSLFACLPLKVKLIALASMLEEITGRVPLTVINQMWFLENLGQGTNSWFDAAKRAYDIILALSILFLTAPFWPLIALAIKLNSPGPVFFTQARAGEGGRLFKIIKFRTMTTANNDFTPTKKNDARITRVGAFLRRTRIDEIPQVLNILAGEMSFVGPRPERPELIKNLETQIPFYRERMLVKPGLTGWDQISGEYHSPSLEDTIKKLQYDLFYIKNRSLYLDLSIILKTIRIMLSRSGR